MPSLTLLLSTLFDHLLRLVPDPADAKRLDDIVDPDASRPGPRSLAPREESGNPGSAVRPSAGSSTRRAAS